MFCLMSLISVSCGKKSGSSSSGEDLTAELTDETTIETDDAVRGASTDTDETDVTKVTVKAGSTVPAQAMTFGSNIKFMNLTAAQKTKYNKAIAIVKKVVATESFRTKVLNFKYGGVKQFVNNNGKSNAQIYQSILDAAENLTPAKNNKMDLGVKMYYQASSVVGYTSTGITYINVNTKFFNSYTANEVAGNLFHEWLHKLGYGHDASATSRRPYSVPYAVGYMIRDLGRNFI